MSKDRTQEDTSLLLLTEMFLTQCLNDVFFFCTYTQTQTHISTCAYISLSIFFLFVSLTTLINLTSYSSKNCYKETQPIFISPAKLLKNMYWKFITLLKV